MFIPDAEVDSGRYGNNFEGVFNSIYAVQWQIS